LNEAGVKSGEIAERDGRLTLDFEDPEGQRLSLIDDGGAAKPIRGRKARCRRSIKSAGSGRSRSACRICKPTDAVLTTLMGMREVRTYPHPESQAHRARLRDG
jgi:glyoxalase family protein